MRSLDSDNTKDYLNLLAPKCVDNKHANIYCRRHTLLLTVQNQQNKTCNILIFTENLKHVDYQLQQAELKNKAIETKYFT